MWEDNPVRKQDGYKDFQEQVFQEISDLETEGKKYPITATAHEYGLTLDEAARLYYKPGMTGKQFLDAMNADRGKSR
jgi:hypothetical protein